MDDVIRKAMEITPAASTRDRIIDITTTGRRTGMPRRIEIFFYRALGRTWLAGPGKPSWYANLVATPDFTFHFKHHVRADLPASARPVTDEETRRRVFTEIVADLNQPANPGHLPQPQRVDDWMAHRLMEITFH